MWQSAANPTTTHCSPTSAGPHHGCPSQSPERILWGGSKHLTPYEIPYRVAGETRCNAGVFPLLLGHPPAVSACEATSSEQLLGRGICSPSLRTGTLFCLSPYSHDPVSLRHFSTPGFFLFVSSLAIPLPPLWHQHLIFTFRLGGTEEAFPCVPPHCSPLVFGNKCDIQGSRSGQSLPGGNHTAGGRIGYPWTQSI